MPQLIVIVAIDCMLFAFSSEIYSKENKKANNAEFRCVSSSSSMPEDPVWLNEEPTEYTAE